MLNVSNISKSFGDTKALNDVSMKVDTSEIMALFGPSGSGKTTLLHIVAGLEIPDSGSIYLDEASLEGIHPHDRGIEVVFQQAGLLPELSVIENIALGARKWSHPTTKRDLKQRISIAAQQAHIPDTVLHARNIRDLSGGERQRVALALVMASNPRLILFDEPLASVDALLRQELRQELRNLRDNLECSFVYVTHDRDDVFELADKVTIIESGAVKQMGTPEEIYRYPSSISVAKLLGPYNTISTKRYVDLFKREPNIQGTLIGIRPEGIFTTTGGGCEATVRSCIFGGKNSFRVSVTLAGDIELIFSNDQPLDRGEIISIEFDEGQMTIF